MKKFLQLISFVFIAVLISVVSLNAQTTQKFNADIPFPFSVGGKTYDAGNYRVKITKSEGSGGIMTLLNSEGEILDVRTVISIGESMASDSSFVFEGSGGNRTLTKIVTTETSYAVTRSDSKRRATLAEKRERSQGAN